MTSDEEKAIRLDERERVFAEIREALALVIGFRPAARKVDEWKKISDEFPENAAPAPTESREDATGERKR